MSWENLHRLAILIVLGMIVQLFAMSYTFITDYNGRKVVVKANRQGCERDKTARAANAVGWRIAQDARLRGGDVSISIRYGKLAETLEKEAKVDCTKEYPKASFIP